MTLAAELRQISCPGCGAGLPVLGGGRVTTHVCGYCGSALDAIEGYRVLRQFTGLHRPASPFSIGMEGRLSGVLYRVIGTLGLEERGAGRWWSWVDHLLYSPTHGYSWLSVEDGHLIWTRRLRGADAQAWLSVATVESADSAPSVYCAGESLTYYETSTATITFAEGEFTWRPMVGDKSTTVSALSDRAMVHFSEGRNEREVDRSVYLPGPETLAAFGVKEPLTPGAVHPLQPWHPDPNDDFLVKGGVAFAVISVILALWMMSGGRQILPQNSFGAANMPRELPLEVTEPYRLVTVDVRGDVTDGWAFVEMAVNDPEGEPVFVTGREIGHYRGYDGDGSWTEDKRSTTLHFRPETAGTYTIEFDVPEAGEGENVSGGPVPNLYVSAREGGANALWLFAAALIFGGIALWKGIGPHLHRRARWRGTDWTDED
ncbi:MAG: DUF4178 domain-containing protein [Gemmobacter sp.]